MENIHFKKIQAIKLVIALFASLLAYLIFTTLVPESSPIRDGYKFLFFGIQIVVLVFGKISSIFMSPYYDYAYARYMKKNKSTSLKSPRLILTFLWAFAWAAFALYLGLKNNIIVSFLG